MALQCSWVIIQGDPVNPENRLAEKCCKSVGENVDCSIRPPTAAAGTHRSTMVSGPERTTKTMVDIILRCYQPSTRSVSARPTRAQDHVVALGAIRLLSIIVLSGTNDTHVAVSFCCPNQRAVVVACNRHLFLSSVFPL